jgi:hypothetical protein
VISDVDEKREVIAAFCLCMKREVEVTESLGGRGKRLRNIAP